MKRKPAKWIQYADIKRYGDVVGVNLNLAAQATLIVPSQHVYGEEVLQAIGMGVSVKNPNYEWKDKFESLDITIASNDGFVANDFNYPMIGYGLDRIRMQCSYYLYYRRPEEENAATINELMDDYSFRKYSITVDLTEEDRIRLRREHSIDTLGRQSDVPLEPHDCKILRAVNKLISIGLFGEITGVRLCTYALFDVTRNRKGHESLLERLAYWELGKHEQYLVAWIGDLLMRLFALNPQATEIDDLEAVVLIDQIELALNPNMRATILSKLLSAFPRVQFIATTYDPAIANGTDAHVITL